METLNKEIRISILEDNIYYNKLLAEQLKQHIGELVKRKKVNVEIDCFSNYSDFLTNFKFETSIAFVDFFLDDNKTGLDVLRKIKSTCFNCKVIVLSDTKNIWDMYLCLLEGASGIIIKDNNAFSLCNYIVYEQIKQLRA